MACLTPNIREERRYKILGWRKSQSWSLREHQEFLPSAKASFPVGSLLGNDVLMEKEMVHKC